MAFPLLVLDIGLTLLAGATLVGLVNASLTFIERALIALVSGLLLGSAATYGLALILGLTPFTVLVGPVAILAIGLALSLVAGDPRVPWREAWQAQKSRWQEHFPWFSLLLLLVGIIAVTAIFGHTLYYDSNGLEAGFPTVWADWAQHLTTASSFAVGGNLPPANPLLSGTPLLYPFLPDFQSATLVTLGLSPALALAAPSGLLMLVGGLLVVALGRRLGLSSGAGVIALLICFIGGGLGFIGIFSDACLSHGFSATQCTFPYVVSHPSQALGIIAGTLHNLPGLVASQPRAYDGLPADGGTAPFANQSWYTPLMAWWLPQRTLLYGFVAALGILILVLAGATRLSRNWGAFILAGALLGLLPLVHLQTLIALIILLLVLLWRRRRREWLALLGVAVALGGVRLLQLFLTTHGSKDGPFGPNLYPWIEPGWLANPTSHLIFNLGNLFVGAYQAVLQLFTTSWWGFWLVNLGVAVPLGLFLIFTGVASQIKGRAARLSGRLTAAFPAPLLELALGGFVVFAVCNLVIFQPWDWDNTKLLVYWYLVVALLIGALATHWWRGRLPRLGSIILVAPVLLTGCLVLLRLLPWTPPADSITGPYTIASSADLQLAATIEKDTPKNAVFLTFGLPNDPILNLGGRTGVMGYGGWLWSYGLDVGSRFQAVQTLYNGCTKTQTPCPIIPLLRKYNISYVEVNNQLGAPGAIDQHENLTWWAKAGFPVLAKTSQITIYDVRPSSALKP